MASIGKDPGGRRRILFTAPDGKRKTVRLGKCSQRLAETVKVRVELLASAKLTGGAIDGETSRWVAGLDSTLYSKLAAVGLLEPRKGATIENLIQSFLAANSHVKPATLVVWGQTARCLRQHFGEARQLRTIGHAEAEGFRQWLAGGKLAASTIAKRVQFARQFFGYAARMEWIEKNPFVGVSHKGGDPAKRQHYITEEDTEKLIDAAPDWGWRTIIALARFGGLRCPSEVLSLRIADLDWEHSAMTVISPKTEGHGHGTRKVPMFARLRPFLEEAWEQAAEGQTNIIPETRYLPASHGPHGWVDCNLRTVFERIVKRAGLTPWPRLFHALRASCESDLAREYPITTVCKWIGNTVAIAARHYVQVTDDDFRKAAMGNETGGETRGTKSGTVSARNAPQGIARKKENPVFSGVCEELRCCTNDQLNQLGIEHPQENTGKTPFSEKRGTESGTVGARIDENPPSRQSILDALKTMPESDRLAIIEALKTPRNAGE